MRLDFYLKEKGFFESREKARVAILGGLVKVDGRTVCTPSKQVDEAAKIETQPSQYVSRGAYKLLGALVRFNVNVENRIAVDIGSSTGGFTDVLLQKKIKKVYCIDVGKNQLHDKIRKNPAVVSYEETDFRNISSDMISGADLIVMDLSFISQELIIPKIKELYPQNDVEVIALLKTQFECGKEIAKKYKGVINNPAIHQKIINKIVSNWKQYGFNIADIALSSIKGGDGNIEYLLHILPSKNSFDVSLISKIVESAFKKCLSLC